ncbi:MAG: DNA-binding response regulator [Rhodospirillaceae bacterium]|nr:DNA-binding response regulator [Rhodospirillaceae bacterium]|tara:strand:+ start:2106 stop:2753 length:648 start_codon:yes stop_codon:yes gene_type:complete
MRLLIVDDHAMFREGVHLLLEQMPQPIEIVEAKSVAEALDAVDHHKEIDLVLLDLYMPGTEEFSGLDALREAAPDMPVVIVSASENADDMYKAIEAGAMGYIPKSSSSKILLGALQLVLTGGIYVPPSLLRHTTEGSGALAARKGVANEEPIGQLTRRQREILEQLTKGKSNKEIARDLNLAEGTVKIHVTAVLKALKVRNRMQAVLKASSMRFN